MLAIPASCRSFRIHPPIHHRIRSLIQPAACIVMLFAVAAPLHAQTQSQTQSQAQTQSADAMPARDDAPATIWLEAEAAAGRGMARHPWYDSVKKNQLSGGDWLSHFDDANPGQAALSFQVDTPGRYNLYLRANPVKSALQYRIDDNPWRNVDFSAAVDQRNIAADDKPDLRFIAWVELPAVPLTRGQHTISFRTTSALHHHGGVDAVVFTTRPFIPEGKTRPDQAPPLDITDESDTWAFQPPEDPFADNALLDLRSMNEPIAGQHGFIRLSDDGMSFVRGDGKPIRFWSVCSYGYRLNPEQMRRHCRRLAKLGVNMVRLHANIAPTGKDQQLTDVNQQEIDRILRFIAVARQHGIYVTLSPYWYHHRMPQGWRKDLPGFENDQMPAGALFFNPTYQAAYKSWVRRLYTTPIPGLGTTLAQEPALAIIQVKNEDSMLFYTMQRLPAQQQEILNTQFADWLIREYGSVDAALAAWDGLTLRDKQGGVAAGLGDHPDRGQLGMYITWHLTQPARGSMAKRLRDQLRFIAWRQHQFYADMHRFYRDELRCPQLTNAMNWKSADKLALDDIERWTYTACDVIAVNRYTGGVHEGANNGYRIDPGHFITNRSMLKNPLQLPTNLKQIAGRPMLITESTWVRPNLYQSEGPFLAAAYMSLTGVDSLMWFAHGEPDWLRDPRRTWWHVRPGDTGYALEKWSAAVPLIQGMFPANALMFRMGYLREAQPVVHEVRPITSLWDRTHPIIAETETFDPNRDERDLRDQTTGRTDVSRLAFLVGPVHMSITSDDPADDNRPTPQAATSAIPALAPDAPKPPRQSRIADLSPYIDADASTVRSRTGQLALNYSTGVMTIDAPKAQGVAGFLREAGGRFTLSTVDITSSNDYAAIQVVALDDRPLAESQRVLIQAGTTARLTGWADQPAVTGEGANARTGRRIVRTGKPPYRITRTHAAISIANPHLRFAVALDPAGYPIRKIQPTHDAGRLTLDLPEDALYVILLAAPQPPPTR